MEDEYIKMGVGSSAEENYFSLNAAGLSFQKFGKQFGTSWSGQNVSTSPWYREAVFIRVSGNFSM